MDANLIKRTVFRTLAVWTILVSLISVAVYGLALTVTENTIWAVGLTLFVISICMVFYVASTRFSMYDAGTVPFLIAALICLVVLFFALDDPFSTLNVMIGIIAILLIITAVYLLKTEIQNITMNLAMIDLNLKKKVSAILTIAVLAELTFVSAGFYIAGKIFLK